MNLLLLMLGGAIGTLARYGVGGLAHRLFTTTFPLGTLLVNLLGSLLIGVLWGLSDNLRMSPNLRAFLFIGLFGGFTTFSTYSLESMNLFRDGEIKMALVNILANNVLGIVLVFTGYLGIRALMNLIKAS